MSVCDFHYRSILPRALAAILAVMTGGLVLQLSERVRAQDVWELTPYRIKVVIASADEAKFTPRRREALERELVTRTDTLIGAAWQLQCVDAPPSIRGAMLQSPEALDFAALSEVSIDCDELALVTLAPVAKGFTVRVRQWDVPTQQLAADEQGWASDSDLTDGVFRLLVSTFTPAAKIEPVDLKTVRLRFRGASLPPRSESILLVQPGDIFRAILRSNQRDGQAKSIRPVEWTYLVVNKVENGQALCQVQTGLRNPLGGRRRGRNEQYALLLRSQPGTTKLLLRSRTDTKRQLAGYDVYAYGTNSKETTHLGRTGNDGLIAIPPGPERLRLLLVKHGDALLARLPIVPGEAPQLTAVVPDDDRRLQAEGLIIGLQENLVDLVVRRAILAAQTRNRIEEGKIDEAGKCIDELRRLRTQQQFLLQLEQERQKLVSDDPVVQKKIDKLFDDTTKLLGNYLMPQELESLESEWNRARSKAASSQPSSTTPSTTEER